MLYQRHNAKNLSIFLPAYFVEKDSIKKERRKTAFGLKKCDSRFLDRKILSRSQNVPEASTTQVGDTAP